MANDKTEALSAVTDILADLLTDVFFQVEKCATIHKVPSGFAAKKKKIELLDVIRDGSHDAVLTGFSHRQAQFEVIQFTVAKQHKSGYCGHYALHNALLARKMCHAGETEEVQELIQIMSSSSAYWWRYWCSLKQLLGRVTYDTWWPWTEDHIVTGDMERSFLHYLLDNHHRPTSKVDPPIFVVQYAFGFIQDSATHIKQLHKAITTFQATPGPSHLVFILGVTNHWASAMITKDATGVTAEKDKISLLYFDSHNVPLITFTDDDILDHMKQREEEHIKKKGKGWTDWERYITKQAITDRREVLHMLVNCAAGSSDLRNEVIEREVNKIVKSFNSDVIETWKELGYCEDALIPLMLNWGESYTPISIRDSLIKLLSIFGASYMSKDVKKSLLDWIKFIDGNKIIPTNIQKLRAIYSVIDAIKRYL